MTSYILDPRRLRFSTYFDWYEGNLQSLFQINGTTVNGIGLLGSDNISTQFNYFQALSRFFSAAALADIPKVDRAITTPSLPPIDPGQNHCCCHRHGKPAWCPG